MAHYAYCCLLEFNITPLAFLEMDFNEKAFLIASLQIKSENEKKQMAKSKRGGR